MKILPKMKAKTFFAAFAAAVALGASAAVITIPEDGTLRMGGTAGDPLNQRENYIVFQPGSTLVITQIGTSATIWTTLVATNGAAYLECVNKGPSVQFHAFAYGAGSLTLRNMEQPFFGHTDHLPVYRLDNLYSDGVDPIVFANGVSVLTFPNQANCSWVFGRNSNLVRLCGSDMFPDDEVITIDSGRSRLMLCNPAAIPSGKTVRVNGDKFLISPLQVPDPEDGIEGRYATGDSKTLVVSGMVYSCNVELPANARMTFTNSAPVTFNGSISGYNSGCGNITISGYKGKSAPVTLGGDNSGFTGQISAGTAGTELVLSNANAAVHATIDMARPMVVRGAEGVPNVSIGAVSGGTDPIECVVRAAANQTISVASVAGCLRISGAGAGSAVDIGTLEPGAVVYDDATAVLTYGGSPALPSGAVRGRTSGDAEFVVMQGDNSSFEAAKNVHAEVLAFDIADGTQVTHGTNAVTVRAGAGVEASLVPFEDEVFSVAGEGSFAVESRLQRSVGWWFDFSRADTRFRIGEGSTDVYLSSNYNNSVDQPYVERVVDWRYPDAANCLWNRRLYNGGGYDLALGVYPHIAATTQNGLQYISMDTSSSSRRLPFSNGSGYNSFASCKAQLVVMVFGVNSSCWAMFGTTDGAFGRAGSSMTYGMTTNDQHDVWLDGVKVDPTTTKFKTGLQVISVAVDGLPFNGLGFWKDFAIGDLNKMGGQNYGEVLIFTNAVSAQMRLEAEVYLARKWGLEAQYSAEAVAQLKALRATNPVCIAAAGCEATTIKAGEQAVAVEGPFVGTVELDGGTLVVPDGPRPYAESDIPSEGRLYWADPDDAETVRHLKDPAFSAETASACSNEVRAVVDKSVRTLESAVGKPLLYGLGSRRPTPILQARGLGPARTWLDFNEHADTSGDGNCLRYIVCPELSTASFKSGNYNTLASMNVRTAFVVQDSIRGGGMPFMGDVNGSTPPYGRKNGTWTQTIWVNNLPAAFANGENRLNGNVVDYAKGFLGQPEVFAVRGTGQVNVPVVGDLYNSERGASKGEIIGEILLYNTALSDADVKGIEAYLMGKWIGRLPEGYADIRNATVAGTGTVQVAVGSQRPNIDRGFEGTVSIAAGGDFMMTIDTDTGKVMGAFDCPAATLELPSNCSITLNFTRKPPKSKATCNYTLVDCASGASGVEWTFTTGANAPRKGLFIKSGNTILYRYFQPGTSILFR